MSLVAGKQVMRVSEPLELEVQVTGSLKMWELGDILRSSAPNPEPTLQPRHVCVLARRFT